MIKFTAIIIVLVQATLAHTVERDQEVLLKLEMPITFRVKKIALSRAAELLATRCGVELEWLKNSDLGTEPMVTLDLKNVRAIDILEIWRMTENTHYTINDGKLRIGVSKPIVEIYNVDDLCGPPPPVMFCGTGLPLPEPGVMLKERRQIMPTVTNIADLLRNVIHPERWDAALGTSIEERGGNLVITNAPEIHREIKDLLALYRAKWLRQISFEARLLTVKTSQLDAVLADAAQRGTYWPYLDDAAMGALAKYVEDGEAQTVFTGTTTSLNTQRAFLSDMSEQKYWPILM